MPNAPENGDKTRSTLFSECRSRRRNEKPLKFLKFHCRAGLYGCVDFFWTSVPTEAAPRAAGRQNRRRIDAREDFRCKSVRFRTGRSGRSISVDCCAALAGQLDHSDSAPIHFQTRRPCTARKATCSRCENQRCQTAMPGQDASASSAGPSLRFDCRGFSGDD